MQRKGEREYRQTKRGKKAERERKRGRKVEEVGRDRKRET